MSLQVASPSPLPHRAQTPRHRWVFAAIAAGLAIVVGAASAGIASLGLSWYDGFVVGLAGLILGFLGLRRLGSAPRTHTRGVWAQLFILEFFGWIALWVFLVGVFAGPA
jgi:hypothetical protein